MLDSLKNSAALEARRQYQREWRKKNPEKCKAIAMRYWAKKAEQAAEGNNGTIKKDSNI